MNRSFSVALVYELPEYDAVLRTKRLVVFGGEYTVCDRDHFGPKACNCVKRWENTPEDGVLIRATIRANAHLIATEEHEVTNGQNPDFMFQTAIKHGGLVFPSIWKDKKGDGSGGGRRK